MEKSTTMYEHSRDGGSCRVGGHMYRRLLVSDEELGYFQFHASRAAAGSTMQHSLSGWVANKSGPGEIRAERHPRLCWTQPVNLACFLVTLAMLIRPSNGNTVSHAAHVVTQAVDCRVWTSRLYPYLLED